MHVVVVGCGRVGSELALTLEQMGHSVAVVDRSARAFRRLHPDFAGLKVTGIGYDRDTLKEAGIERAGAFAAVTYGDNSNIVCARIAHETYEIPNVVARIKDPRRALIFQRLGIPTVATVSWATDQVIRRLFPTDTPHDWIDPSAKVCLLERTLPAKAVGRKLGELNEPGRFWLTAVSRFGSAMIATGDIVGQEGDIVYFMCAVDALDELNNRLTAAPEGHH
ncbi:MAG TPA: TrkA family potassium uptake protein [Acidimicrobiia bacterium]